MGSARRVRGRRRLSDLESHVIKRSSLLVLMCVLLAAASGCSRRHTIHIESDRCWAGTVNGDQSISGCGNSTYKVLGAMRCVAVRRTDPGGTLRVRIDDHPWVSATDQFGNVQACN